MLGIGQQFPAFEVDATVSTDLKTAFRTREQMGIVIPLMMYTASVVLQ